jgi:NaMN:DMB phosphoribosyltransferase
LAKKIRNILEARNREVEGFKWLAQIGGKVQVLEIGIAIRSRINFRV